MMNNGDNRMNSELSFEQASAELDTIIEKLNSGSTSLEEMVQLYEKGTELVNYCTKLLDSYRGRIEKVTVQHDV